MAAVPRSRMARRENLLGWLMVSPWLIGFVCFVTGPILASLALSFSSWDILRPPRFAGFANYAELLSGSSLFWQAMQVTTVYAFVTVPLHVTLALLVAILLNQRVKGLALFRTIYYLPSVVSGVAIAYLWQWILNTDYGLVNWLLWTLFHIEGPAWLVDPHWALSGLILMGLWSFGGPMVIFLASLQGVPVEIQEAAAIDGANAVRRFRHVTLPMITPVVLFNLTLGLIGALQMFTQSYIITALGMAGNLVSAPIVAYAFARLRWTGRDRLFALVLATIMLPAQVTIIPQFILFKEIGWVNTFLPLIVPAWLGGGAFNTFLFRQFFLTLPLDLDDAAKIDGADALTILWRIILPLSMPALATVAVFSFVYHWNDFFAPLIYLNDQRLYTVSLALRLIVSRTGSQLPQWNLLMAASLIVVAPVLVLFFIAQRFFVRGIVLSGIRG